MPVPNSNPNSPTRPLAPLAPLVEYQFVNARLAALYDRFYPPEQRADFAYYLPLIFAAPSVLDVGCGTGALLHMAR